MSADHVIQSNKIISGLGQEERRQRRKKRRKRKAHAFILDPHPIRATSLEGVARFESDSSLVN